MPSYYDFGSGFSFTKEWNNSINVKYSSLYLSIPRNNYQAADLPSLVSSFGPYLLKLICISSWKSLSFGLVLKSNRLCYSAS